MHGQQCNTCGGFERLDVCTHCTTVVCEQCKPNHGYLCEELQKRKKRGEGRTIANSQVPPHRRGHEAPPTTAPDRKLSKPAILGAPYKLSEAVVPGENRGGLWDYANALLPITPESQPVDPIDQSLQAVKDLIKES
jgi:hypothetical protein